jgi:intracellular septation protein A
MVAQPSPENHQRAQLEAAAERPARLNLRGMLPSLLVNVVAPIAVYRLLESQGVAVVPALMATAVCPVVGILIGWVRTRRLDVIGGISLVFIVLGVATSFFSDDPLFFLIKESFITGLFGLACFVSLVVLPRPLLFYISRQFAAGDNPALAERFEGFWQYPQFRTMQRRITLVWGVAYVVEALVRVVLALSVPIPVFLGVSPLMGMVVTVSLIAWTIAYSQRTARRGALLLGQRGRPSPAADQPAV